MKNIEKHFLEQAPSWDRMKDNPASHKRNNKCTKK